MANSRRGQRAQTRRKPKTRRDESPEPMATDDTAASNEAREDSGSSHVAGEPTDTHAHPTNATDDAAAKALSEEGDDALSNDVVFQCGSCRSVVGDTLSDYEAHLESKTISLRAARGIDIDDKMKIANTGYDAGCTYMPIKCSECHHLLGRVYGSTTPALDSRRRTYTFDTTSLISYQLGTCLTIDGEPIEINHHNRVMGNASAGQASQPEQPKIEVQTEAFEALHAHVASLTEVTNKLGTSFDQNCSTVVKVKELTDASTSAIEELKSSLEHAQNMMLLWEERFQRLEACEQRVDQLAAASQRINSCEGRVARVEAALGGFASPSGHQTVLRTPSRLKVSPSIRRPTASPARAAMRAAVSPGRAAMRTGPSPARAPRRTELSPAVTPSSQLARRRR